MQFAHVHLLSLLWITPFCVAMLILAYRKKIQRLRVFSKYRISELLDLRLDKKRSLSKGTLHTLAIVLLIIAIARPRWGFEWKDLPKGGVDIMVVLDLSTSMLATDISPNRLERAKREIIDLISMMEGDRLGIVAFAGVPFVQCPLTTDYRLAILFVNQLNLDLIPVQGTALGDAIKLAVERLKDSSTQDSQGKAIILITDGEDQNNNTLAAAHEAKKQGVKIFAIGIGKKEGAPIPLPKGGYKKDRNGNVIISKLDEESLEQAALITEGVYVRSTSGDLDLDQIYKKGIKTSIESGEYGIVRQKIWYERYQWFLLITIILLFTEFMLKEFKRKKETSNEI